MKFFFKYILITDKPAINYFAFLKNNKNFKITFVFFHPVVFLKYLNLLKKENFLYIGMFNFYFYKLFPSLAKFDLFIISLFFKKKFQDFFFSKMLIFFKSLNQINLHILLPLKGSKQWELFCSNLKKKTGAKISMFQHTLFYSSFKSNNFKVNEIFLYKNYKKNHFLKISNNIKKHIVGNPSLVLLKKKKNLKNILIYLQPYDYNTQLKLYNLVNQSKKNYPNFNFKIYMHHSMTTKSLVYNLYRDYDRIFYEIQNYLIYNKIIISISSTGTMEPYFVNTKRIYLNFLVKKPRLRSHVSEIFKKFGYIVNSEKDYFEIFNKLINDKFSNKNLIKRIKEEFGCHGIKSKNKIIKYLKSND